MGLHNTAHYLKSKGRNDDTELVHMTKGEVQALKGLAAKHGGSLTTNPETGLPEAGFLGSILPMVAGVAAAAFAPELLPLIAGGVGLADYAMTGSITKGLMAGLSAYGAGGIGEALEGLGGEAIGEAVKPAAEEAGTNALVESGYNPTTTQMNPQDMSQLVAKGSITPAQAEAYGSAYSSAFPAGGGLSQMGTGLSAAAQAPGTFLANNVGNIGMAAAPALMDIMGQRPTLPGTPAAGSSNPFGLATMSPNYQPTRPSQPNPYYVARYPDYKRNPYQPGIASPTYPSESGSYTPITAADGGLMSSGPDKTDFMGGGAFPMSQQTRSYYATPTQMPTSAQSAMAGYEPKTNPLTGEVTALAQGGIASYSGKYGSVVAMQDAVNNLEDLYGTHGKQDYLPKGDAGVYQDTDPNTRNLSAYEAALYRLKAKAKGAGMDKEAIVLPKAALTMGDIQDTDYASGGIAGAPSLGSYAAGGNPRLLKGPGDGMSDSIPANIGGKQPARLADGEFVVPADVVSHLGNGSTDAGAKKLYSMMDNIRKARTGKKKQAPAVKADKYLPK